MSVLQDLSGILESHYIWTLSLLAVFAVYLTKWMSTIGRKFPPGPRGLPILGYLPFLRKEMHLDFVELRKKYGDIFSLMIGVQRVVVLNNFQLIKEAFNNDDISEKPPKFVEFPGDVENMANRGSWRDWRKFILTSLRNMGMGKRKLDAVMEEEVQGLLDRFSSSQGDVNMHELIFPAVNSVIISMICGKRLKEDESFSKTVDSFSHRTLAYRKTNAFLMYLPFLRPFRRLIFYKVQEAVSILRLMENRLWEEIASHEREESDEPPEDFIEYYLKEVKESKQNNPYFNKKYLNGNSQVLLFAGNDTTVTSIEWILLRMAQRQDIQEKVYQEIVGVYGKEKIPTWVEKDRLPYFDAVLTEASRLHAIAPSGVPHLTYNDTKIGNYDIPKNSVIFANLYAVHKDPKLWDKPEEFNPDRFLTSDGKRIKDPEHLIPFGFGKRSCVGERLARVELFIFVSTILQHFKILPPSGGLSFESEMALVLHPKYPVIQVQERK